MSSFISNTISRKSLFHVWNEDSYFISDNLIIVADGMGGESSGDIASRIAVDTVTSILKPSITDSISAEAAREMMFSAISLADRSISDHIIRHPDSAGMGTTILVAVVIENRIHIAWCGDSHCFLFNNGNIQSLTKDHSYVQELIDNNEISVEESFSHPDNNLITRYVGGGEDVCLPEFISHKISTDDIYVFCSDGLSGYCRPEDIGECIASNKYTSDLPLRLLEQATAHGSDDDITIVTLITRKSLTRQHSSFLGWLKKKAHTA